MNPEQATQLRAPFDGKHVGKLPRVTCKACRENKAEKVCPKHTKTKCAECGNYLTTAHIHLDYVGHAVVTDRLLQVDPEWTWEPLATDQNGFPVFDSQGGLWIRLTIGGVTRPGYGEPGNIGPKEAIGDALRNAAMRFGVALDLWSKEDLSDSPAEEEVSQGNTGRGPVPERAAIDPNTRRNFQGAYLGLKSLVGKDATDQFVADTLREKGAKKFDDLSAEDADVVLDRVEQYRLQMAEGIPA